MIVMELVKQTRLKNDVCTMNVIVRCTGAFVINNVDNYTFNIILLYSPKALLVPSTASPLSAEKRMYGFSTIYKTRTHTEHTNVMARISIYL